MNTHPAEFARQLADSHHHDLLGAAATRRSRRSTSATREAPRTEHRRTLTLRAAIGIGVAMFLAGGVTAQAFVADVDEAPPPTVQQPTRGTPSPVRTPIRGI